jgi:hypothetical protein
MIILIIGVISVISSIIINETLVKKNNTLVTSTALPSSTTSFNYINYINSNYLLVLNNNYNDINIDKIYSANNIQIALKRFTTNIYINTTTPPSFFMLPIEGLNSNNLCVDLLLSNDTFFIILENSTIKSSTDGATWTTEFKHIDIVSTVSPLTTVSSLTNIQSSSIYYNNDIYYLLLANNIKSYVYKKKNNVWTLLNTFNRLYSSIVYAYDKLLLFGKLNFPVEQTTYNMSYISNPESSNTITNINILDYKQFKEVLFANGFLIAISYQSFEIIWSTDGINWTKISNKTNIQYNCIIFDDDQKAIYAFGIKRININTANFIISIGKITSSTTITWTTSPYSHFVTGICKK